MNNFNTNNFSQSSNYKIFLPFLGKEVVYAQTVSLPGINHNPTQMYLGSGKKAYVLGDGVDYDPITITLIIDEKFRIYKKLVEFFFKKIHPNSGVLEPDPTDFSIGVEITDNLGKPIIAFEYYGCQLQNLGAIMLGSNSIDVENTTDLTIVFSDMQMVDYVDNERIAKFLNSGKK